MLSHSVCLRRHQFGASSKQQQRSFTESAAAAALGNRQEVEAPERTLLLVCLMNPGSLCRLSNTQTIQAFLFLFCFVFHFITARNEGNRSDARKTAKVRGELQKDSLCFGSLSELLCTFAKQAFALAPSVPVLFPLLSNSGPL